MPDTNQPSHRDAHGRPDPRPGVEVAPTVRVTAGSEGAVRARVTNRAAGPRILAVAALGVDPSWLTAPVRTEVLAPGASQEVVLTVAPPTGTLPATYPLAVAAQSIDPATGRATATEQVAGLAETSLVVNPRARVSVDLEPAELTAVSSRRFTVVLRNSGGAPAEVRLSAAHPRNGRVKLRKHVTTVPADGEVRIRARARVRRPRMIGYGYRYGFTVSATSQESSRIADGGLTQRTVVGPGGLKAVALFAVLAVWIASAVVLMPQLAERVRQSSEDKAASAAEGSPDDAASNAPGSGGAGSGGAGEGGADGGSGAAGGADGEAGGVQLAGTVLGDAPSGVTVTLDARSLVDEEMQGRGIGVDPSEFDTDSPRLVSSFTDVLPTEARPAQRAETGDTGAWSFGGVASPGYYLLTFAKAGYQTQRFVVDSSSEAAKEPLEVELVPGEGTLSGRITGPDGKPYGGASVTITDGTTSITTSSTSAGGTGEIGSWRVTGLSTPSTYVVSATAHDMSTEARTITLAASGEGSADLRLANGVTLVRGRAITMSRHGDPQGLGGVSVSVSDGDDVVHTATSLTEGGTGLFFVPGIPAPGVYTVTLSATGYQPMSRRIELRRGQATLRLDDVTLQTSTGEVVGHVEGQVDAPASARTVASKARRDETTIPLDATGLTLSNNTTSYKTTSSTADAEAGERSTFGFSGVTPGIYTLSADYFGYAAWHQIVRVTAGTAAKQTVVALSPTVGGGQPSTATVVGSAVSAGAAGSGTDLTCTDECLRATLVATVPTASGGTVRRTYTDTFPADGAYQLPAPDDTQCATAAAPNAVCGLLAGHYTVTVSSPGYVAQDISVEVAEARQTTAPVAELVPVPALVGQLSLADTDGATNPGPVPDTCVWVETTSTASASHTAAECADAIEAGLLVAGGGAADPNTDPGACTAGGHANLGVEAGRDTWCAALVGGATDYRVEVPTEGVHTVTVVSTDPEYVPSSPPTALDLRQGANPYNVVLQRLGRVALTVRRPAATPEGTDEPTDTLVAAAGVTPTVDPMPPTARVTATGPDGKTLVTGLPAGSYTVSGASGVNTGRTTVITVTNTTTAATLSLTDPITALVGQVSGSRLGSSVFIGGAQVALEGAIGFDDGGNATAYQTVFATAQANGCIGVRITRDPGIPPCTTWPGSSRTTADFTTSTMRSIVVSAPGWETRTFRKKVLDPNVVNGLELFPSLVPVTLPVTVAPAGSPLDPASVDVTVAGPPGRTVTSGVVADGAGMRLTWTDSGRYPGDTVAAAGGAAVPGTYTVTLRADGFAPVTHTVTCGFAAAACTVDSPLVLPRLGSVALTVRGGDGTIPVQGVEVTAQLSGGASDGVTHATRLTDRNGDVVLDDIVAGDDTDYVLVVRAPGHADGTTSLTPTAADAVRLTCTVGATTSRRISVAPGGTATCDLALTPTGVVQGTLRAVYDLPGVGDTTTSFEGLTGRRVTAQRCLSVVSGWCTSVAPGPGFSAVTDGTGAFAVHGTIAADMTEGPWLLSATPAPGFHAPTPGPTDPAGALPGTLVEVPAGLRTGVRVDHYATPTDLTIEVTDGYHPVTGVTVRLVRPETGAVVSQVPAVAAGDGDALVYRVDAVVPGYWWIDITGTGVVGGARQSVYIAPASSNNTTRVVIARVFGAVHGEVSDGDTDLLVPNARVQLSCVVTGTTLCPDSGPALSVSHEPLVTTTDARGLYRLEGVAEGRYRLSVSADGYADDDDGSRADVVVTNAEVEVSVELTATMRRVETTVDGSGSSALAAADVVLTPVGDTPGPVQTVTVGGFAQLRPGCYRVGLERPDLFYARIDPPRVTIEGAVPADDPALSCPAGAVEVPTTGTSPLLLTWTSDATELTYTYTASPWSGHTAPVAALSVTRTDAAATAITVPDARAGAIWVDPGAYRIAPVMPAADRDWWDVTDASGTAGVDAFAVSATELTTTITVDVAQLGAAESAAISLTPGPEQDGVAPSPSTGTVTGAGTVTFTVPRGNWVVDGTWAHGPDAQVVAVDQRRAYDVTLQPDPGSFPRGPAPSSTPTTADPDAPAAPSAPATPADPVVPSDPATTGEPTASPTG